MQCRGFSWEVGNNTWNRLWAQILRPQGLQTANRINKNGRPCGLCEPERQVYPGSVLAQQPKRTDKIVAAAQIFARSLLSGSEQLQTSRCLQ
jgi:hypothetical protein